MKQFIKYYMMFFLLITSQNIFAQNDLNEFNFLTGEWEADFGKYKYYEKWFKDGDQFIGNGYRIKEENKFEGEKLLLLDIHGYISYIATVGRQRPVLFSLSENIDSNFIFENKEHDFPQKITYKIISANKIIVFVEGKTKGEYIKDEYVLNRISE